MWLIKCACPLISDHLRIRMPLMWPALHSAVCTCTSVAGLFGHLGVFNEVCGMVIEMLWIFIYAKLNSKEKKIEFGGYGDPFIFIILYNRRNEKWGLYFFCHFDALLFYCFSIKRAQLRPRLTYSGASRARFWAAYLTRREAHQCHLHSGGPIRRHRRRGKRCASRAPCVHSCALRSLRF